MFASVSEQHIWRERWANDEIGWHLTEVHPDLVAHATRFLGGGRKRVFVPLCGKSLDLKWLVDQGHEVVAVELVPKAVAELHAEQGIEAEVLEEGAFTVHRSPSLTVFCGDYFDLTPNLLGDVDRVWDRAALIAVEPSWQERYVAQIRTLCSSEALILQSGVEYDTSVMDGPPWPVDGEDLRRLYEGVPIELLDRKDVIDDSAWRKRGHEYFLFALYYLELQQAELPHLEDVF